MRKTRKPVHTIKVEIGGDTLRGTPSRLAEKLDTLGEEAAARGEYLVAEQMWQTSEYFKKEFDIHRNS